MKQRNPNLFSTHRLSHSYCSFASVNQPFLQKKKNINVSFTTTHLQQASLGESEPCFLNFISVLSAKGPSTYDVFTL